MRGPPIVLVCLALALASCSKGEVTSGADVVAEATARNVATVAGEAAFEDEGVPVGGNLSCTAASSGGAARVTITCSGTSKRGADLEMDGTVTSLEEGERG